MNHIAIACAAALASASTSHAAILDYEFDFTVDFNGISSGIFAATSVGDEFTIRYVVDTGIAPTSTEADRSEWNFAGAAAGSLIQEIRITGDSISHTIPGSALTQAAALVLDNWENGVTTEDAFTLQGFLSFSDPNLRFVSANLFESILSPGSPATSLDGTDLPTQSAEIDPSSFNASSVVMFGPANQGSLSGFITAARVPAPMTLACLAPAALVATRRRR